MSTLIPWRLQLTVLQQEHYELGRFVRWILNHFLERRLPQKKKLVWTAKTGLLLLAALLSWAISCGLLAMALGIWGIVIAMLLVSQPWIFLVLAQLLLLPIERRKKRAIIRGAIEKLSSMPNVQVIGIAGSYGKTSVKTILAHLLKGWKKVLETPLSRNVPLGIAEVIDLELTNAYDFFIAEMGEFYPGDIRELSEMLHPVAGMITGLNAQHAERLGTLEQAGATLFELADFLLLINKPVLVNGEDRNIVSYVRSHGLEGRVEPYGTATSPLRAENITFTDQGTSFTLHSPHGITPVTIPLLGAGQVTNILGALGMASALGAPMQHLISRLASLPQVPHRLERKIWDNGLLLIDDAYNSNVDGFKQALDVLSKLPRSIKILVTPGIIELGDQTKTIHQELGTIANEASSLVILVGKSERTEALAENIHTGKKRWIEDIRELWTIIPEVCPDPSDAVVLLENDLPESAM